VIKFMGLFLGLSHGVSANKSELSPDSDKTPDSDGIDRLQGL